MNYSKADNKSLAWLDLETTGTSATDDAILELGLVITPMPEEGEKPDLGILGKSSWVIKPSRPVSITDIDPYVWNMHTESGLWQESLEAELTLDEAVFEMVCFLESWLAEGSPLCGNSIHFDRKFLASQARSLHDRFHYRNLDVSSIKNMVLHHFPHVPEYAPGTKPHRVLSDLENSISEYTHYLTHLGAFE
jgi:oligoribonuclease